MLTIAGVSYAIEPPFDESFEYAGDEVRNFDLGLSSQVRARKRNWSCTTSEITAAQVNTLDANTLLDAPVTVTDTLRSITITARVRIRPQGQANAQWKVALDIKEI